MIVNYQRFERLRMRSRMANPAALDAEFTRDEGGSSNSSEPTTNRRPREFSGRFIGGSSSLNTREADHESDQSGSKPRVTTTNDLETLLEGGFHVGSHEGALTDHDDYSKFSSVVLFEVVSVASGLSSTSEIRYLPLVAMGDEAAPCSIPDPVAQPPRGFISTNPFGGAPNRQAQIQPQMAVASKPRPIGILAETKRYIDDVRTRRTLQPVVEPESEAASRVTRQAKDSRASVTEDEVATVPGLWPARQVPVELFEMITRTLSHRDIRNMRLVSKEFESKTSAVLFKEVVVPFTTDLYDMIEEDASARLDSMCMLQRSGTSTAALDAQRTSNFGGASERRLAYRKTSENSSEHGLRVFEGFGPHMSRFGMRFEVTEADLITAPYKKVGTRHVEAYHGDYEWPPPGYARFGRLASLEKIADETPRMTAAFKNLKNVREIGLSLDSGLGFLSGPDKSHHDMIFEKFATVFEDAGSSGRPTTDGAEKFWSCLRQSHSSFTSSVQLSQTKLMACILTSGNDDIGDLPTVCSTEYDDTSLWPSIKADGILSGMNLTAPVRGIFYTAKEDSAGANDPSKVGPSVSLSPASLTSQQKQWILETGWAQSAFLDTYTLAIADNPQVFHQITRVTISKISSGLLAQLDREAFWKSLPSVKDVTLLVSPDWRTVCKDDAGCAITPSLTPSTALDTFHAVLRRVACLDKLQRLCVGYTDGGENAKGMFARNSNVMPAPIATLSQLLQPEPDVLSLAHIKHVILLNCWISPHALLRFTSGSSTAILGKTLTLDSVSLTANTRPELQSWLRVNGIMDFREMCWPSLIHRLGKLVQHEPEDAESHSHSMTSTHSKEPAHSSSYQRIDFKSCGYVYLQLNGNFDQSALQLPPGLMHFLPDIDLAGHFFAGHDMDWYRRRADQLRPHMLRAKDDYLGRIVPCLPAIEVMAIKEWQMLVGPSDIYDESEQAENDGLQRKGTGRFWGHVQTNEAAPSAFARGFDG